MLYEVITNQLNGIRARLIALIITGLLLAPLAGLAGAVLFGLITAAELGSLRTLATLSGFVGLVTCLAYVHFSRYFSNQGVRPGTQQQPASLPAPVITSYSIHYTKLYDVFRLVLGDQTAQHVDDAIDRASRLPGGIGETLQVGHVVV